MADLYRSDIVDVDLNKSLQRTYAGELLATGDKQSNRYGARVFRQGEAVSLTGCAVTGYFIRPDTETVVISGAVSGNVAYVDLPQACYTNQGNFSLAVKISGSGITQTVRIIDGYIRLTQTDVQIDPGTVIPTLDDLFTQIEAMEQATAETEAATAAAEQATADAKTATNNILTSNAPAIIPTATGEVITVSDSAKRPLAGLRVYGKTTQAGTPTPDNPVPLVNAGSGGTVTVTATGKNLLKNTATTLSVYGVTFTVNADGSVTANGTSTARALFSVGRAMYPAGEYVFSQGFVGKENGAVTYLTYKKDGKTVFVDLVDVTEKKFTLMEATDIECLCDVRVAGVTLTSHVFYPMIRPASMIDATFEPYKDGGSASFSTPNGLPGIPVSSGGNYTDENGQQWICDEIIWPEMTYVQNILTKAFDGTEAWRKAALDGADTFVLDNVYGVPFKLDKILCSHAKQVYSNIEQGVYMSTQYAVVLVFELGTMPTLDAFIAYLKEQAANGTPVTVMNICATPTETTPELYPYNNLIAHYPNTTILNDGGVGMAVDYVADTKTYIDQRIASLLSSN